MKSIKNLKKEAVSLDQMTAIKGGASWSLDGGTVIGGGSRPVRPTSMVFIG